MVRRIRSVILASVLVAFALAVDAQTPSTCSGDCDADATVTIDEIVRLVTAVLSGDASSCSAGDFDRDGSITVDEVITAVTNALYGCTVSLPPSEAIRLFPGLKLEVGGGPVALAVADFDADGRPDVSTANGGSNDLSLLLRTGNGGFKRFARASAGDGPRFVLATKLGSTGRHAILAANSESNELSVTQVREGTAVTDKYGVGENPVALATADLDADSIEDVIVANRGSGDVSVLLGESDGSFVPALSFAAGASPSSIATGDVDGDLIADVVAAIGTQQLAVLFGSGDGDLSAPTFVDAQVPVRVVLIDDLNGDDAVDLVFLGKVSESENAASIGTILGRGDGTFAAAEVVVAESPSRGIAISDIDGDRVPDLVSAGDATVSVLFGRGDGTFLSEVALPSGCSVSAVAVADLDGDGAKDIVSTCGLNDEVAVLWGLGGRQFAAEQILPAGGLLPQRILAADVNADDATDLATVNGLSDDVSILQARGDGQFAPPIVVATQAGLLGAALGDLNGDAAADLVSSHESATCRDCLVVFSSEADGTFERRRQLAASPRVVGLAIADVDGDALGDIISLGAAGVSLFVGLDGFQFQPERKFAAGADPRAMAVVDLNGDAVSDVATVNVGSADVSVLLSTGNGDFSPAFTLPLTTEPAGISAVDVNADGRTDLVVRAAGRLSIFFGQGDGAFSAEQQVSIPVRGGPVVFGDVDTDGLPDIVAIGGGSAVYLGQGTGSFLPALRFAGNPLAVDLALVDVNVDGVPDIVTANATLPGSVSVMLGARP